MKQPATYANKDGIVNVIIETPRGHRNKYVYDPGLDLFRLKKTLPLGASFPFDFGYIPGTKGQDGDPIDVLVLIDEPAFPGCLVECRMLGALKAEQQDKKGMIRNDRLVAVHTRSRMYGAKRDIKDIEKEILEEIEHFFVSYNQISNKQFTPMGWVGADGAHGLIAESLG